MYGPVLEGRGDFGEWRDAARAALAADIRPEMIDWRLRDDGAGLLDFAGEPLPAAGSGSGQVSVPASFVALAQAVICHSDAGRFALLYRLLWRLRQDRALLQFKSDPDVSEVRLLEKSVRRDCHKMTAFVRFKEVPLPQGQGGRRRFIAWFEPDHFIVERTAAFFQRRFTDMDWLIATPKGSARWDGNALQTSREAAEKPDLTDETDELWRTYYANIFNPARLKIKAMTAEMPKKYWKNLPEADLIPGLVLGAEARVLEMAAKAASQPQPFHHRLQAASAARETPQPAPDGTLASLAREAGHCTRCPLHCNATQTVFGSGPEDANIMIVGEQPGDHEDLAGKPFVGPAGQLFDRTLAQIGIERKKLYVTNAVKHFKYETRGKRRIHQRPNAGEVEQCRWWLNQEIALVRPKLIVAMGATALYALTGGKEKVTEIRGRPLPMEEGRTLFVTVHPSYLLRLVDTQAKEAEMAKFTKDMQFIRAFE
ncbi:UdgX family uracil-DNA binding protein [Agrobacterium tumefaciens]|uniref:UdgX family uracil-DNA binding protein n=1 Tax=Agrobacterium tumefaciens TaxID=358 RepID=UPI0021D24333|nr:UdgX family uracil-DNA binding protein [Agrobacterium tumefaciens]UXS10778.1 UdgX family uracil-DNA binding protein [Agrobacterium tumefaciens]UXS17096.1 UdgX family uracil-DNA binding protein [Agrobacterium tumefaciens]UXT65711.1 UdgX family uracil-DNA binding protein [Agrobacterium tumefaciens]